VQKQEGREICVGEMKFIEVILDVRVARWWLVVELVVDKLVVRLLVAKDQGGEREGRERTGGRKKKKLGRETDFLSTLHPIFFILRR